MDFAVPNLMLEYTLFIKFYRYGFKTEEQNGGNENHQGKVESTLDQHVSILSICLQRSSRKTLFFHHDFANSFSFSSSLSFRREEKIITKVVVKKQCLSARSLTNYLWNLWITFSNYKKYLPSFHKWSM